MNIYPFISCFSIPLEGIRAFSFNPDGSLLYCLQSLNSSPVILICDLSSLSIKDSFPLPPLKLVALHRVCVTDSLLIVFGSSTFIFSLHTRKLLHSFDSYLNILPPNFHPCDCSFLSNDSLLLTYKNISASHEKVFRCIFHLTSFCFFPLPVYTSFSPGCTFSIPSHFVVYRPRSQDFFTYIYSSSSLSLLTTLSEPSIFFPILSPNSKYLLLSKFNSSYSIYSLPSGSFIKSFQLSPHTHPSPSFHPSFHPFDKYFVSYDLSFLHFWFFP